MFESYSLPRHYKGLRHLASGESSHVYVIESLENTPTPAVVKIPHRGLKWNMLKYALAGYLLFSDYSGFPVSAKELIKKEKRHMQDAEDAKVPVAHAYADHTDVDHPFLAYLPAEVLGQPFLIESFVPGKTYAEILQERSRSEQKQAMIALGRSVGMMHGQGRQGHFDLTPNNAMEGAILIDRGFAHNGNYVPLHFMQRDFHIFFSELIKRGQPEGFIPRIADETAENIELFLDGYAEHSPYWEDILRRTANDGPFFGSRLCANARVATVESEKVLPFELIARYNELQRDVLRPWTERNAARETAARPLVARQVAANE